MMRCLLSVCVTLYLVVLTTAEEIPKCEGVTDEQLEEIKKMAVTEDIDDMLNGNFSQVHGPKAPLDKDDDICINIRYKKSEDGQIVSTVEMQGEVFSGTKTVMDTFHKIQNGIYVLKSSTGEVNGVAIYFFAKPKVLARFTCWTTAHTTGDGDSKHKLNSVTTVETSWRPMNAETTAFANEAVKQIEEHSNLFGEIGYYHILC